jgi:phosphate transport system protein
VLKRDAEVDRLFVKVFADLIELMGKRPEVINLGIHVQSVAKWLERAGDHAMNLAEYAIFRVKGHDGRHAGRS